MKALISADWHLRGDRPRCRIDGGKLIGEEAANNAWMSFQRNCIEKIANIANDYHCQLIVCGDIFNRSHVPDRVVSDAAYVFLKVKSGTKFLAGNHDLPGHNFSNAVDSSIGILLAMDSFFENSNLSDTGCWAHFGEKINKPKNGSDILFLHRLVFESAKEMPPNVEACTAAELLKEFPTMKWIFIGDMHRAFHYCKNGRHVVNPGCINRQDAKEKEYKPSVYYTDTEAEKVERIFLDDDSIMVEDAYLIEEKDRDEKLEAFAEAVKNEKNDDFSLSFVDNLKQELSRKHKILGDEVFDEVLELIEEGEKE
jgi:DNA repair exonuclease SbcCD nuclease subunit